MPSYVFQQLVDKGIRSNVLPTLETQSVNWFRKEAAKTSVNPNTLLKSDRSKIVKVPLLGQMYLFAYDPKHKATLPYYDRFPLIIPFDTIRTNGRAGTTDGFMGMNFHYLPLILRAKLMDGLMEYVSNQAMDESTRIKVSYRFLKRVSSLRYFQPCVKQYLFSHMRSRFFYITPTEWNMALFLSLQRFEKASSSKVWKDSRDKLY